MPRSLHQVLHTRVCQVYTVPCQSAAPHTPLLPPGFKTLSFDFTRVLLIRNAPLESLLSVSYLEHELLPALGFNPQRLDELPVVMRNNGGGVLSWQYPNQFARYLDFIRGLGVRSYLEIGCKWGGAFVTAVEYLKRFGPIDYAVGVDAGESLAGHWQFLPEDNSYFVRANSTAPDFLRWVTTMHFDVVFIDGDHSYAGVRRDFLNLLPVGRVFVFHDIAGSGLPGVVRFWIELKALYSHMFTFTEILDQYEDIALANPDEWTPYMGIGIAVRKGGA